MLPLARGQNNDAEKLRSFSNANVGLHLFGTVLGSDENVITPFHTDYYDNVAIQVLYVSC